MKNIMFILLLIIICGLNIINAKEAYNNLNNNSGVDKSLCIVMGPKINPSDTTVINKGNQIQKQNRQNNLNRNNDNIQLSEQITDMDRLKLKVRDCVKQAEQIQDLIKYMAKEIIKSEENEKSIKEKYSAINDMITLMEIKNADFISELEKDQKKDLEELLKNIEKIKDKAVNINESIHKEIKSEKINKKNILKLNLNLENEFNKLGRQYRAIEWLLEH